MLVLIAHLSDQLAIVYALVSFTFHAFTIVLVAMHFHANNNL